jgi:long-chain acyl-CoA synthetase
MPDPRTIHGLIEASIRAHPQRPALGLAFTAPLTYTGLGESIRLAAAALAARGLNRGARVAILGENSPAWGVAYLAITRCGAIAVPILPDFPEADIHHILREATVEFVFTTRRQLDKILEFAGHTLAGIFTLDDSDPEHRDTTETFSGLLHQGASLPQEAIDANGSQPVSPDDIASIIYTSGTSGHAKAVMLSHANICANVASAQALISFLPCSVQSPLDGGSVQSPLEGGPTFLSILPLSHAYEFTLGFILPLACGGRVVYADRAPTPTILEKICRQERPDAICAVPMVMDKIYKKKVLPAITASFWFRQLARYGWTRRVIRKRIGARLVAFFGGSLKVMAIGGAAMNLETETFLREAGFPYMAGYGLTEASPLLAAGVAGDPSVAVGSVGPPVPGVEVRIDSPDQVTGIGQIMARGANIMKGYYHNPGLTAETIDQEGWLATGDLGFFDEVGNLHIKGRSKSVIVLANGENIYPEAIEDRINSVAQVVESLVVERDGRLEALVYLDYEVVEREATGQEAQRHYVQQLLAGIKETVNQQVAPYSRLHQVRERTEPFVKTATQKIKRYLYQ